MWLIFFLFLPPYIFHALTFCMTWILSLTLCMTLTISNVYDNLYDLDNALCMTSTKKKKV